MRIRPLLNVFVTGLANFVARTHAQLIDYPVSAQDRVIINNLKQNLDLDELTALIYAFDPLTPGSVSTAYELKINEFARLQKEPGTSSELYQSLVDSVTSTVYTIDPDTGLAEPTLIGRAVEYFKGLSADLGFDLFFEMINEKGLIEGIRDQLPESSIATTRINAFLTFIDTIDWDNIPASTQSKHLSDYKKYEQFHLAQNLDQSLTRLMYQVRSNPSLALQFDMKVGNKIKCFVTIDLCIKSASDVNNYLTMRQDNFIQNFNTYPDPETSTKEEVEHELNIVTGAILGDINQLETKIDSGLAQIKEIHESQKRLEEQELNTQKQIKAFKDAITSQIKEYQESQQTIQIKNARLALEDALNVFSSQLKMDAVVSSINGISIIASLTGNPALAHQVSVVGNGLLKIWSQFNNHSENLKKITLGASMGLMSATMMQALSQFATGIGIFSSMVSIIGAFLKKGPSATEIILRELADIKRQLNSIQEDVHEVNSNVINMHLDMIEGFNTVLDELLTLEVLARQTKIDIKIVKKEIIDMREGIYSRFRKLYVMIGEKFTQPFRDAYTAAINKKELSYDDFSDYMDNFYFFATEESLSTTLTCDAINLKDALSEQLKSRYDFSAVDLSGCENLLFMDLIANRVIVPRDAMFLRFRTMYLDSRGRLLPERFANLDVFTDAIKGYIILGRNHPQHLKRYLSNQSNAPLQRLLDQASAYHADISSIPSRKFVERTTNGLNQTFTGMLQTQDVLFKEYLYEKYDDQTGENHADYLQRAIKDLNIPKIPDLTNQASEWAVRVFANNALQVVIEKYADNLNKIRPCNEGLPASRRTLSVDATVLRSKAPTLEQIMQSPHVPIEFTGVDGLHKHVLEVISQKDVLPSLLNSIIPGQPKLKFCYHANWAVVSDNKVLVFSNGETNVEYQRHNDKVISANLYLGVSDAQSYYNSSTNNSFLYYKIYYGMYIKAPSLYKYEFKYVNNVWQKVLIWAKGCDETYDPTKEMKTNTLTPRGSTIPYYDVLISDQNIGLANLDPAYFIFENAAKELIRILGVAESETRRYDGLWVIGYDVILSGYPGSRAFPYSNPLHFGPGGSGGTARYNQQALVLENTLREIKSDFFSWMADTLTDTSENRVGFEYEVERFFLALIGQVVFPTLSHEDAIVGRLFFNSSIPHKYQVANIYKELSLVMKNATNEAHFDDFRFELKRYFDRSLYTLSEVLLALARRNYVRGIRNANDNAILTQLINSLAVLANDAGTYLALEQCDNPQPSLMTYNISGINIKGTCNVTSDRMRWYKDGADVLQAEFSKFGITITQNETLQYMREYSTILPYAARRFVLVSDKFQKMLAGIGYVDNEYIYIYAPNTPAGKPSIYKYQFTLAWGVGSLVPGPGAPNWGVGGKEQIFVSNEHCGIDGTQHLVEEIIKYSDVKGVMSNALHPKATKEPSVEQPGREKSDWAHSGATIAVPMIKYLKNTYKRMGFIHLHGMKTRTFMLTLNNCATQQYTKNAASLATVFCIACAENLPPRWVRTSSDLPGAINGKPLTDRKNANDSLIWFAADGIQTSNFLGNVIINVGDKDSGRSLHMEVAGDVRLNAENARFLAGTIKDTGACWSRYEHSVHNPWKFIGDMSTYITFVIKSARTMVPPVTAADKERLAATMSKMSARELRGDDVVAMHTEAVKKERSKLRAKM